LQLSQPHGEQSLGLPQPLQKLAPGSLPQVYSTAVLAQHAEGLVVSVSGPTQVQMPPLHVPETHSTLDEHVAPLGR
jgi:hypothetical protein